MIKYYCTLVLLSYSFIGLSQNSEIPYITGADSTWTQEHFTFPLGFAPEIPFEGFEEALFPKGWTKIEDPYFWTYAFVWNIDLIAALNTPQLEDYLKKYYDGLMRAVNKEVGLKIPSTVAKIDKITEDSFQGEVTVYDAFKSKKLLKLFLTVNQTFCEEDKRSLVIFRISPKEFDDDVWISLKKLGLHTDICY